MDMGSEFVMNIFKLIRYVTSIREAKEEQTLIRIKTLCLLKINIDPHRFLNESC